MLSLGNDGSIRPFIHPYLQAWGMFVGEIGCLVVYLLVRQRRFYIRRVNGSNIGPYDPILDAPKFEPFLFMIPAMLDLTSTCISYTGLILTYASSYQMLRSASIVFTAFLTQFVLKTSISLIRWLGVIFIVCGLVTVGVTGIT
jgi:drug/metabolite transporter (DMT)-like permease